MGNKSLFDRLSKDARRKQQALIREATGIDINSAFTAERQREAVLTAQAIMKRGVIYRDHKAMWEQLKNPPHTI